MRREEAKMLLDLLARLQRQEDPTIEWLLSNCPLLAASDCINRYGPISEWPILTAELATDTVAWLVKVLVIAERDLDWIGGSVAAPIWLFRAYQSRRDAAPDLLADWVLRNSKNQFLPFGSSTFACSLEDWRAEQRRKAEHRIEHDRLQHLKQEDKALRIRQKVEQAARRKVDSLNRMRQFTQVLNQLAAMAPTERLPFIASENSLPLETIPESLISSCLDFADELPAEMRQLLLRRLDRRHSRIWKKLRRALGEP